MLIDAKLKEKLGKLKTKDRGIEGVGKTVLEPRTHDCDPSAKVIVEGEDYDLLKHDIHIKPKSYKLELVGELVV